MSLTLSPEQESALSTILTWYTDHHGAHAEPPVLTLGGYAGTGKTTLIKRLVADLGFSFDPDEDAEPRALIPATVRVSAFTGKACHVLRKKGVDAETLHSMFYTAYKKDGKVCYALRSSPPPGDLLIIDESSMVSTQLWTDIRSLWKKPILCVGDHGQLEPVGDNPGLMLNPILKLETIHRQALGSPIIRFAHHLREGGPPDSFLQGSAVGFGELNGNLSILPSRPFAFDETFQVICAMNATRHLVNATYREHLGHKGLVVPGEKVICLRNNRSLGLFNGLMCAITRVGKRDFRNNLTLDLSTDDGRTLEGISVSPLAFGTNIPQDVHTHRDVCFFDYSYCITCHKSQGSEFEKVAVIEEPCSLWSMPRWRYTAATRASSTLLYHTA